MSGFLDLPEEMRDPSRASVSILPVPYDATSTWMKGADAGPGAIIDASAAVEWYDIETAREPCRDGITTLEPVVEEGTRMPPEEMSRLVEKAVRAELDAGRLPVVLGGEHSVTIGALRACAAARPGMTILQIDAHADTREEYEGSDHNHACVMARARELGPIVQVGIRSMEAGERAGLDESRVFYAHDILSAPDDRWMDEVVGLLTDDVYLTFDLDAFDPSLLPATGTPEPGGLDWRRVNELVKRVCAAKRLVGFDVVELCPMEGQNASAFTAAKLVYRIISEVRR